jgi:putative membrane protein
MKIFFDGAYQDRLDQAIQELELRSSVEFVTVIYPHSDDYRDVELWGGIISAGIFLVVTFMVPMIIHLYIILFGTLLAFSLGVGIVKHLPNFKRFLINKKRTQRHAEIMARAVFQKAHLYRTSHHTAVLLFVSALEQQTILLWDLNVDIELTAEELDQLKAQFQTIFQAKQPEEALLQTIGNSIPLFEARLPIRPNDINELPNHLHVQL